MIFLTRKKLSRRFVLRGAGATLALPLLEAMQPAFTAERSTPAGPVRRLSVVEYPHGVVPETWDPVGEGANYTMSDSLAPLAPFREKFIVIRGLTSAPDRTKPEFHDRAIASFLTGCEPTKDKVQVGISIDQIAAQKLGGASRFSSLELCTEDVGFLGSMCYKDANTNLPMERNPRRVFERLFGEGDRIDPAAQAAMLDDQVSILDSVREQIAGLRRQLGAGDQRKLEQYVEAVRDIERRVKAVWERPAVGLPSIPRPRGMPDSWPDHVKLMFDLQVLALQADLTRVVTFATTEEGSTRVFGHLGLTSTFHEISHHNYEPGKLAALTKINRHHSELFAYYLGKLNDTHDAYGSLLDQTVILYGSTLSNPTIHSQHNLPIVVAGGGGIGIKGGRFVRLPGVETPLTNLHVALLNRVGVPTEKVGDSTGVLDCLSA